MKDSGASGTKQLPPAPADVVDLIRSIGQAMTNSNLYSIRHPVTASAIEHAYERFVPLMEQCGSITFALFEDHLTVNGELVDTNNHLAAKFAERMRSLGIEGFTAEKETTPDEFVRLVLFFASNAMADGSKGPAALSTECGFDHVKSKTVRYEQVLDGQAVVDDKTASQVQSLRGFVVENIMAFLKGDVDSDGKAALGNLENVENNAQALGEMILKAAVVRQQSPDLSQGETLGRLVVGCLRRTFSSLSADPAARTQKGEKALTRSLIMLEKDVLDRRLQQMRQEGVVFETGVDAGRDLSVKYLQRTFDAVLIAAGATAARDLAIPGRALKGIHLAMDFLSQQNRQTAGDTITDVEAISAVGKNVVVLGGGDTGSDCVGTSLRQGARSVTQIEIMPQPPTERSERNPWPDWSYILRTSSSQEEGGTRLWGWNTQEFLGASGQLQAIRCMEVQPDSGNGAFQKIPGTEKEIATNLVLMAAGFLHVEHGPLVKDTNMALDKRGIIQVEDQFQTTTRGIFAAGDSTLGASLVVRAIHQGRQAAAAIDAYLTT
jgi:thioredoxin reductase